MVNYIACPHCHRQLPANFVARAFASLRANFKGGRPRQLDRCECGEMTKKRAKARAHKCDGTIPIPKGEET